jgi:hypothetical protein
MVQECKPLQHILNPCTKHSQAKHPLKEWVFVSSLYHFVLKNTGYINNGSNLGWDELAS